jgi:hypothetical protein
VLTAGYLILEPLDLYLLSFPLRLTRTVVNVTHPDHLVASSKVRDLHELVAVERKADCPKCSPAASSSFGSGAGSSSSSSSGSGSGSSSSSPVGSGPGSPSSSFPSSSSARPTRSTRSSASAPSSSPASSGSLAIQCRFTDSTGPPLLMLQTYYGVHPSAIELAEALSFALPLNGRSNRYSVSGVTLWDGSHYDALVPDATAASWWLFDCRKASGVRRSTAAAQSAVRAARSQLWFFSNAGTVRFLLSLFLFMSCR